MNNSSTPDNFGAERVDIDKTNEMQKWCKELNVSPEQLKIAIIEVGSKIENIKNFFRIQRHRFDCSFY